MTISNSDRTAGPFQGNGINNTFPFSFKIFSRADLLVATTSMVDGAETILTLDADYSVTMNPDQVNFPGGYITTAANLSTQTLLAITSNIANVQSLDLTNNGGFYPDQINGTLDRIVVMIQQVAAKVNGTLNIGGAAAVQTVAKLVTSVGASVIGFIQAGTGTVRRTVQAELRDFVKVPQFGDVEGVDATSAFQKAPSGALVPPGTYMLSQHITGKVFYSFSDITITGPGSAKIINLQAKKDGGEFTAIESQPYPGTSLNYKSEASQVVTNTGVLLAFYRIGDSHVNGATNVTSYLVYRRYDRATNAWVDLKTLDFAAGFDTRNQVAGVNEATGRLFCFYCQSQYDSSGEIVESTRRTYMKYSDDNGATWSSQVNISQYCPYPSADNVPFGKVVSFANGSLLITLYNYHTIFTLKSSDNGLTWGTTSNAVPNNNPNLRTLYSTPTASDDNYTEPTIVKISEQNLVCIARSIQTGVVSDGSVLFRYLGRKWQASTYYQEGMYVYVFPSRVYICTGSGTSGSSEPTQTDGGAYQNGSAVFKYIGSYSIWAANTAYSASAYVETYSSYMYQVSVAGTTSNTAPLYSKIANEEPEMVYFKSSDAGNTWSTGQTVRWTDANFHVTNSPPSAVVVGGTLHLAWFARSPEWTLYYVKMSARAFFENPAWAFSKSDGEPRSRVMRSFLYSQANNYGYRIDCGYVNLIRMPNSLDVMAAWYDNPNTANGVINPYSTIVQG